MRKVLICLSLFVAGFASPGHAASYQKAILLACIGQVCAGQTAKVPAGKTLTVTSFSCQATVTPGGTNAFGLVDSGASSSFRQYFQLNQVFSGQVTNGVTATRFTVKGGDFLQVAVSLPAGQTGSGGSCGIAGILK